jgi:hypothetical protein
VQWQDRTAKNTSSLEDRLAIYYQFQVLNLKEKDWIFSKGIARNRLQQQNKVRQVYT